jgi:hypothetical protein
MTSFSMMSLSAHTIPKSQLLRGRTIHIFSYGYLCSLQQIDMSFCLDFTLGYLVDTFVLLLVSICPEGEYGRYGDVWYIRRIRCMQSGHLAYLVASARFACFSGSCCVMITLSMYLGCLSVKAASNSLGRVQFDKTLCFLSHFRDSSCSSLVCSCKACNCVRSLSGLHTAIWYIQVYSVGFL